MKLRLGGIGDRDLLPPTSSAMLSVSHTLRISFAERIDYGFQVIDRIGDIGIGTGIGIVCVV